MNASVNHEALIVAELSAAYAQLETAKKQVLLLETELLTLSEPPPGGEGTVKHDHYKVAYAISVTVPAAESKKLQGQWEGLGENAQKAFKWKAEIDKAQFRAIKDLDAAAFAELAPYVVSKPSKPVITLLES